MDSIHLYPLDIALIVVALTGMIALGLWAGRSAEKSLEGYFLGGRNLPWALAGLSMVATTFAADTPLAVTEMVAADGISGNWLWWNLLAGGMLTAVVFAPLWRRAGVVTEAELIELRYHGKPALWLRIFRAVYLGLFINLLILGWVHVAMTSVLQGLFGLPADTAFWLTTGLTLIVALYAATSGLFGVVLTDAVQFILAMTGSIALAIFVIQSPEVGGLDGLQAALPAETLDFFPTISTSASGSGLAIGLGAFFAYFGMMWWSAWYPGAEPGGGGYVAQRVMGTKDESHAVGATLFFNFAHYALRPWPWILVGLAAITLFRLPDQVPTELQSALTEVQALEGYSPKWLTGEESPSDVAAATQVLVVREGLRQAAQDSPALAEALKYHVDPRFGYIFAMKHYLPKGWMGLMLVAFFSAYMSTISTQLNWGASYLMNDVWLRLGKDKPSGPTIVRRSFVLVLILAAISLAVSTQINSIKGVWLFIMECGAGLGLVLILRWFWGRINAYVEITATVAPFVGFGLARSGWISDSLSAFPNSFFFTVAFTTIAWILVLLVTKPSAAWPAFKARIYSKGLTSVRILLSRWILAVVAAYSLLFAMGSFLLHPGSEALWYGLSFVISGALLLLTFRMSTLSRMFKG
ncbi:MAG: sodium:solute symporter family protein [Schleiferiaceae bacterium]